MKKIATFIAAIAAIVALGLVGVACAGVTPEDTPTEYTVTYAIGEGATGTAPTGGKYKAGDKFTLAAAT